MKRLEDYTECEVIKFDMMSSALAEYNKQFSKRGRKVAMKPRPFTTEEIMAHSQYRELYLARCCEDEDI